MDNIVAISAASLSFLENLIITTSFVISEETTATDWCFGFFLFFLLLGFFFDCGSSTAATVELIFTV
jgi:hypothetical protein